MSILTYALPQAIKLGGVYYPIRSDFRLWLRIGEQIQNIGKDPAACALRVISEAYKKVPPAPDEAMDGILWFLGGGRKGKGKKGGKKERIYDFEADAEYIFSAFYQQYHIDLTETDMHWWKFLALLGGLNEDCLFVKIMGYRSQDLAKIKDKEQRSYYRKMKALYRLPDIRTKEEKEKDFINALEAMMQ